MLQHGFRSNHLLLDTAVAPRIASLLTTRDKHLRLGICLPRRERTTLTFCLTKWLYVFFGCV